MINRNNFQTDDTLTVTTTHGQSGPGSNDNGRGLHTHQCLELQNWSLLMRSSLMSYLGYPLYFGGGWKVLSLYRGFSQHIQSLLFWSITHSLSLQHLNNQEFLVVFFALKDLVSVRDQINSQEVGFRQYNKKASFFFNA